MNVVKKDMVIIPPSINDYYRLKQYYQKKQICKNCKSSEIVFLEKNRILSCVCTPNCKSNMRILIDSYVTYDENYNEIKQNYDDSVNIVLREKFDIIFKYKKAKDITKIAAHYTSAKKKFQEIQTTQIEKIEKRDALLKPYLDMRDEMIKGIKEHDRSNPIEEDLNETLNKIHEISYTTIGNTTFFMPDFDLEIFTLK